MDLSVLSLQLTLNLQLFQSKNLNKKAVIQQMVLGKLYIHIQINELGPLPNTIHKN